MSRPVPTVEGPRLVTSPSRQGGLGSVLSSYRTSRNLSVRRAGELVGGSHHVWAKWEAGAVPNPVYLRRLAGVLELPVSEVRRLAGPDPVRLPSTLGEEQSHPLARARLQAGLSAAEFARRLHVSPSLVSRWEDGKRLPLRRGFPAIAHVLGSDMSLVSELFGDQVAVGDWVPIPSLQVCRERRGMSRAALARLIGVEPTTAQRWERERRAPHRRAVAMAAELGVDLSALMRPALVRARPRPVVPPLRRIRLQRELSLRIVAGRVGVNSSSLKAWECGISQPSWAHARVLARVLKVPVSQVFAATGLDVPRHLDPARWTAGQLPAILTELRRWQGWTQRDLARVTGVSVTTVRAWEGGHRRPRPGALGRLDQHLKTSIQLSALR